MSRPQVSFNDKETRQVLSDASTNLKMFDDTLDMIKEDLRHAIKMADSEDVDKALFAVSRWNELAKEYEIAYMRRASLQKEIDLFVFTAEHASNVNLPEDIKESFPYNDRRA